MRSVAFTHDSESAAAEHLLRSDGDEDICFALWRPSEGRTRTTALIGEVLLPVDGDRILQGNVAFTPQFLERAIAAAREAGTGLAMLHSHPDYARGWQDLSRDDRRAEAGIAGAVLAATGLPLVGMTVAGGDRTWSGRFWLRVAPRTYDAEWCETVRVVDDALRVDFCDRLHPPPVEREELARTRAAWGPEGQARLARLRVGVVGLGSVGSIVVEALARMGVQHLVLLDFDSLEVINRDRTLHAYPHNAGIGCAKVAIAAEAARCGATATTFKAEELELSVCEENGYRSALDCDVLFSCVDRPWARSILNYIAYAHLIPVVDGGIHVSRTERGRMRGADWKAHIAAPGRRCLRCLQQFDPALVQTEREGHLDDPNYIETLPKESNLRRSENVFAFSLAAASLEVLQLLSMVIGPAGVHDYGGQTYHMATGTLETAPSTCETWCGYPELVGRGEHGPHPGTGPHPRAERARAQRAVAAANLGGRRRA